MPMPGVRVIPLGLKLRLGYLGVAMGEEMETEKDTEEWDG